MPRYFLTLAYDGTDYVGWQRQPKGTSVQGTIEATLTTLLRQPVNITGSGRTDAGVHAQGQIAHLDWGTILDIQDLKYRLNILLPSNITCRSIEQVEDRKHARFSAIWREYTYYCSLSRSPFTSRFCARLPYAFLDKDVMQEAAQYLIGAGNYRSFSKVVPDEHYLCHIMQAEWSLLPQASLISQLGDTYAFTIRANRFLRGQVRAIVGSLLEVGCGNKPPEWIRDVLNQQTMQVPTRLASPEGLHLMQVGYEL